MRPTHTWPARVAFKTLDIALPTTMKDEVIGDLMQEFQQLRQQSHSAQPTLWLWRQTLSCLLRFALTPMRLGLAGLWTMALGLSGLLIVTVAVLSDFDEPSLLDKAFWLNGQFHQIYVEPVFWQSINDDLLARTQVHMFMHPWSILWAALVLASVWLLEKRYWVSGKAALWLSAVAIFLPYVGSALYIGLNDLRLNQVGPVLAFGLISMLFLLLPLSWWVTGKLRSNQAPV